jgi:Flp pilus assembly protein TadG
MKRCSRGTALMEFALAWPVVLLLVLGAVQFAVWESEVASAHQAAVAGARAGTIAGAGVDVAARVALRAMSASLVGVSATTWCSRDRRPMPRGVWVCATDLGLAVQVDVGGSVPALFPISPAGGLPLRAHVVLSKETFVR